MAKTVQQIELEILKLSWERFDLRADFSTPAQRRWEEIMAQIDGLRADQKKLQFVVDTGFNF